MTAKTRKAGDALTAELVKAIRKGTLPKKLERALWRYFDANVKEKTK